MNDTDTSAARISDTEILFLLAQSGNDIYEAAASGCEQIGGMFANYRDKTVGPLTVRYGDQAGRWATHAGVIRKRKSRRTGFTAVMTQETKGHVFELGMFDHTVDERVQSDD
jgi:hypothetical protein